MSVLLRGGNGNEFELGFIRDSYPDVQDGTGDSSYVTCTFRVATEDESWEETSPCLNMFEFKNLAEWLEAAGAEPGGAPELSEVELLGPELKFSVTEHGPKALTIRVSFHLEGRPEELQVDAPTEDLEYVDIHIDRPNVLAAARVLRDSLEDLDRDNLKDDLEGAEDPGQMGLPEDSLNMVDEITDRPPGAGAGEDNAGDR